MDWRRIGLTVGMLSAVIAAFVGGFAYPNATLWALAVVISLATVFYIAALAWAAAGIVLKRK